MQLWINTGGFIATGVNKAYSTHTTDIGWMVPSALQGIFPIIILVGLPFIPLSPRWLILKGRREEAVQVLKKMRPKEYVLNGLCEMEVAAIEHAIRDQHQEEKGPFKELFMGSVNRRRTSIAGTIMLGAQLTGQAFTGQYGTRFYQQVGFQHLAFTYNVIGSSCSWLASFLILFMMDTIGRRPIVSDDLPILFGTITIVSLTVSPS